MVARSWGVVTAILGVVTGNLGVVTGILGLFWAPKACFAHEWRGNSAPDVVLGWFRATFGRFAAVFRGIVFRLYQKPLKMAQNGPIWQIGPKWLFWGSFGGFGGERKTFFSKKFNERAPTPPQGPNTHNFLGGAATT